MKKRRQWKKESVERTNVTERTNLTEITKIRKWREVAKDLETERNRKMWVRKECAGGMGRNNKHRGIERAKVI